jgi:cohesin loading factor subunit SCC2
LGQELAFALKQVNVWVTDEEQQPNVDNKKVLTFGQKIKDALRDVWKDHSTDVFDIGYVPACYTTGNLPDGLSSHEEVVRIDRLAEEIGTIQCLKNSFHPILNVILLALDAPPVFMRTKALRALGQIVTSDPTILSAVCHQRYFISEAKTNLRPA